MILCPHYPWPQKGGGNRSLTTPNQTAANRQNALVWKAIKGTDKMTTESTTKLVSVGGGLTKLRPAAEDPVTVYMARLGQGSRETMLGALTTFAGIIGGEGTDPRTIPWGELRYQHTQALRQRVAERYAPATANKVLCALRGVLRESWRLGQMSAEDYRRAIDLAPSVAKPCPVGDP